METLPPPPPPPSADTEAPMAGPERPRHIPRPGELTTGWLILTGIGWIGVAVVLAATWGASRQLGLSTWWLGPLQDQRPVYVMFLPFVAPAVMLLVAGNRVRYIPFFGVLGAAATAAVGLGDLGRVRRIGVVELIAAAAALLVSIASLSGMYRGANASADDDSEVSADTGIASGTVADGGAVVPAGGPASG